MNNKERVLAALNHKAPDKVPYQVEFTRRARQKMAEYYGDEHFARGIGSCLSGVSCEPVDAWKEVAPDVWEDEFGVRWDRRVDKDIGVVCNRAVSPENVDDFEMPSPDEEKRFWEFERIGEGERDRFLVANFGFTLFERAWSLAGMEEILAGMAGGEEFVERLLDRILEFNLRLIRRACTYPIDAMLFGDDWGQQRGLIMGPELWRRYIKPRIREMYGAVKSGGKFVFHTFMRKGG